MNDNIYKGVILVVCAGFVLGQDFDNEVEMVADVIKSFEKPTSVLFYDCWKPTKKMKFISKLADTQHPKTVQFIHSFDNITSSSEIKDMIIVAMLKCPGSLHFLKQANATGKLRNPYRWLIIDENNDSNNKIASDLVDLNILLDSEVILATKEYSYYSLKLIYKLQLNSNDWRSEPFGTWSSRGLNKTQYMETSPSIRRKNLERIPVAVSTVVSTNATKIDLLTLNLIYNDLHIDFVSKASIRQLHPLFEFINATRLLVFTDNWGYIVNGTYNGMIGDIVRGAADLTGTVTFITKPRLKILEYLSYPSTATVMFVFRQPSLSYQNNLFVLPFKPNVWICILGVVVLMMFIIFMTAQWESIKLDKDDDNLEKSTLAPNMGEIAMMIIGAITQQGSYTELKGTLGRVVMFLIFLLFLFLYTSYSANIVALLQSSSNEIKTLADLLNSKMELGVEDTPYNRHHFSAATEPVRKAIYEKKIAPRGSQPHFITLEEGVKKLQKKPFAFNMFVGGGYRLVERYFLEHEKCGLQEIQYIQENKPWLTCRKTSPFKEIYKIGLTRNHEHGLNDRVNRMIYAKKPQCIVHGGIFDSVNMTDFYPALLMLLYGMLLAVVLLIIEILHFQRIHRKLKCFQKENKRFP